MNAKERLDRYLAGEKTDRQPNLTIVGSVVTQYNGMDVETYCRDWRSMTRAAVLCARDLRLDFVQIASDLVREAEGYGSVISYFPDKLPSVGKYALTDIGQVSSLKPLSAESIPRLYALAEATAYARELEPEIWPMTLAVGPATAAANLRGVEDLLVDSFDEPEAVEALLGLMADTTVTFLRTLASAGARYVYVADPVASLLSPDAYEALVLPLHQKLFGEMTRLGITGRLHMCGDTTRILPLSCGCGAAIVDIDHAVDYPTALTAARGRCLLNGNVDPVADVYDCTPDHTREAILAAGRRLGGARGLLMPGCELPTKTPLANARAIADALAELGA